MTGRVPRLFGRRGYGVYVVPPRGRSILKRDAPKRLGETLDTLALECAAIYSSSAQDQLRPGHGYLTGYLHDHIQPRRGFAPGGASAASVGTHGTVEYEEDVDKRYHFYAAAVRDATSAIRRRLRNIMKDFYRG